MAASNAMDKKQKIVRGVTSGLMIAFGILFLYVVATKGFNLLTTVIGAGLVFFGVFRGRAILPKNTAIQKKKSSKAPDKW